MKRLKVFYVLVFAVGGMILNGCGTSAHIEKDEAANFKNYKTYTWLDKENKEKLRNEIAAQNLKSIVNDELQKNGFREVKNNPDLLLSYDLLVEKSVKEQSDPVYSRPYSRVYYNPYTRRYGSIYYPSQFLGYDSYSTPVKEGTVSISMVDTKTDKTVWQGWTTNELNSNQFSSKEVQKNVRSIFKKFEVADK
ncbi:MAG: DUF4136 domain-containing protein [Ginsengibacter sp.]